MDWRELVVNESEKLSYHVEIVHIFVDAVAHAIADIEDMRPEDRTVKNVLSSLTGYQRYLKDQPVNIRQTILDDQLQECFSRLHQKVQRKLDD